MPGTGNSGGHNAKTLDRLKNGGTYRDDRHSGFKNMRHVPGRPDAPKDLKGEALDAWDNMVSLLEMAGSLAKTDGPAIYQYAKLFAETAVCERRSDKIMKNIDKLIAESNRLDGDGLVEAMRQIANLEKIVAGYNGMVRQGRMALRQYLVEFGMTSSARGRVKLPGGGEDSRMGKLTAFRGGKVG